MAHLNRENYHGKNEVRAVGKEILDKWQHLLDLLEAHQQKLGRDNDMLSHLRDLDTVHTSVATLQQSFNNDEFQKAADIDSSMQKLNLVTYTDQKENLSRCENFETITINYNFVSFLVHHCCLILFPVRVGDQRHRRRHQTVEGSGQAIRNFAKGCQLYQQ